MNHAGLEAIRALVADAHLGQGTVAEQREAMSATAGSVPAPDGVTVEPDTVGARPAEWLVPTGAARSRVILYLHGGAYVTGGLDTHRNLAGRLAIASGWPVVTLEYRLAPEHRFPSPVLDVRAALDDLGGRGIGVNRTALAGDSAGGGLALAVIGALVAGGRPTPAAVVAFSPWTDLTVSSASVTSRADVDPLCSPADLRWMAAGYLDGAVATDPLASPRFTEPDVLAGFPPVRIDVGDAEVLLDDSVDFASRARSAGADVELTVWPNLVHVFQAFPPELIPESVLSVDAAGAFLARHLA